MYGLKAVPFRETHNYPTAVFSGRILRRFVSQDEIRWGRGVDSHPNDKSVVRMGHPASGAEALKLLLYRCTA
jgi:hypothetical protein